MRAWLWFARRFGLRLAWRYYRDGRKQGWMTDEQAERFLAALMVGESVAEAHRAALGNAEIVDGA